MDAHPAETTKLLESRAEAVTAAWSGHKKGPVSPSNQFTAVRKTAWNTDHRQTFHVLYCGFEVAIIAVLAFGTPQLFGRLDVPSSILACLIFIVLALTAAARRLIVQSDPHSLASKYCSPVQALVSSTSAFFFVIALQVLLGEKHIEWQIHWAVLSIGIIYLARKVLYSCGLGFTDGGVAIFGDPVAAHRILEAAGKSNRRSVVAALPYDAPSSLSTLRAMVDAGHVEGVVLAGLPNDHRQDVVTAIADLPVAVYLALDFGLTQQNLDSVIPILPNNLSGQGGLQKRGLDIIGATVGLLVAAPVFMIIATLIKLESRGPIFFRQARVGLGGCSTEVWKFRTMYVAHADQSGEARTVARDPRVTPFGRILRRLSIDELPQLMNVLQGSMSLVGPRPHVARMRVGTAFYRDAVSHYSLRHRVKPGITGWAQINGSRGEVDTFDKAERRISLDLWYISNWSIGLDLKILARTLLGGFVTFKAD